MTMLLRARMLRLLWILASSGAHEVAAQLGAPSALVRLMRVLSLTRSDHHQGKALGRALERLGAGFIKLGQLLATREDIVGAEVARALSFLHDDLKPMKPAQAKRRLEAVLGGAWQKHFRSCDFSAVKAASIAQIHKATTHDGKTVAIKLLRFGVARQFAHDFTLLRAVADWIDNYRPDLRRLHLHKVLDHLEVTVRNELDLRQEAAAISIIGEELHKSRHHRVPKVYWRWHHKELLVLEWMDGVRLDKAQLTKKERTAIVTHVTRALFQQIFQQGFFHADIHPGNILLDEQKRIVWLDFGITGMIEEEERLLLAMMMDNFFRHDYHAVAQLHKQAGYVAVTESTQAFALAMRRIAAPVMHRPLKEVSMARVVAQILNLAEDFDMAVQPQLLMLQKTLFLLESLARLLNDDMDLWSLGHEEVKKWLKEQTPLTRAQKNIHQLLPMMRHLPQQMRDLAASWHKAAESLQHITKDGIRLHQETVQPLRQKNNWGRLALLFLGGFAGGAIIGYTVSLWDVIVAGLETASDIWNLLLSWL